MSIKPLSGCLSSKEISQLNDRLNELSFNLGTTLDEAFQKILTAEFEICDASDIPADTGGVQQFLCITDGVCTFFDKSEIVKLNETITSIGFDSTTNLLTYVDEAGTSQPLDLSSLVSDPETVTSISFDSTTNTITYIGEDGASTPLTLTSSTVVVDTTDNTVTHTGSDGVATTWPLVQPEPSCFYVDGDKTQGNAANKICDAIDNGKALAFTDGAGVVDQILSPATAAGVDAYVTAQGGTYDAATQTWTGADKIAVCCEEEVCGLQPQLVSNNTTRTVNNPGNVVMYRPGYPYELSVDIINATTGIPQTLASTGAWVATDHIITAGPPAFNSTEDVTVTSADGSLVCEPDCIEYEYWIVDMDRSASVTVLNPTDLTNVIPSATTANGSWAQDPLDPNKWDYTQINANSNGFIRFVTTCDKQIIVQTDNVDFVGQIFRQTVRRPALLKYVCDASVASNRVSAEGPNGAVVNVNNVDIS